MKTHTIKITIDIQERTINDNELTGIPEKVGDGSFEINLDSSKSLDIDACEQALLSANFPALRDALCKHFENELKKNI